MAQPAEASFVRHTLERIQARTQPTEWVAPETTGGGEVTPFAAGNDGTPADWQAILNSPWVVGNVGYDQS